MELYIHTCIMNGKKYVGISNNSYKRWGKNGVGYKPHGNHSKLWSAIQKYGWDNFTHEIILAFLTEEEANWYEEYIISLLDTYENGYNSTTGGGGYGKGKDSYSKEYAYKKHKNYRIKHRDKLKKQSKKHYDEHIEYYKEYYMDNKERISKQNKEYRITHKQQISEKHKQRRDRIKESKLKVQKPSWIKNLSIWEKYIENK